MAGFNAVDELRRKKAAERKRKQREKEKANKPVFKGGRPTQAEKDKIRALFLKGKSDEEISQVILRSPETVKRIRQDELLLGDDIPQRKKETQPFMMELTKRPEWVRLQDQFLPDELEMFKLEYAKLMNEMKDDLRPTDEIHVFSLIQHMILIHRNYVERKKALVQINNLEKECDRILSFGTDSKEDQDRVMEIGKQIMFFTQANTSKSGELKNLEERKSKIQQELKITRDQRISKLENNKRENYLDLLIQLEDEDFRKSAGQIMEINRLAMEKEKERLSQDYVYMDGTISKPLLTSETVGELPKLESRFE